MKNEKIAYGLSSILIIAGATMKILHLPYANIIFLLGLAATILFQTWHVTQLKKRITELESKI